MVSCSKENYIRPKDRLRKTQKVKEKAESTVVETTALEASTPSPPIFSAIT